MSIVWEVLDNSLAWIQGEPPLQVALTLLCCTILVVGSIAFAARRLRPTRLDERRFVGRPVLVAWQDRVGRRQSDDGFCQDVSAGGMGLDLPSPLKVGTHLNLTATEMKLSCTAVVRRCRRIGPRYAVGVRFDRRISTLAGLF